MNLKAFTNFIQSDFQVKIIMTQANGNRSENNTLQKKQTNKHIYIFFGPLIMLVKL